MNIDINALLGGAARRLTGPDEAIVAGEGGHFAQLLAGLTDEAPLLPETLAEVGVFPSLPEDEMPDDLLPEIIAADDKAALPDLEVVLLTPPPVPPTPPLAAQSALPGSWQLQQMVAQNAGADAPDAPLPGAVIREAKPSLRPVMLQPEPLNQPVTQQQETLPATLPQLGALAINTVKPPVVSAGAGTEALPMLEGSDSSDMQHIAVPRPLLTAIPLPAPAAPPVVANPHPVGTPAWQQSLGQQLAIFSRDGIDNAQIKLHPEELGALQINLRMQQNQAQLHIISEHPQVRQALEAAMPQLRSALAESGVQLGQTSVSADNPHSAGAQAQGNGSSGNGNARQGAAESLPEEDIIQPVGRHNLTSASGINTFA